VDSWYAILRPSGVPESFRATASLLQQHIGGSLVATPHVTISYLEGNARPEVLVERLERLSHPIVQIHGKGLFRFEPGGRTPFMHVEKTPAIKALHYKVANVLDGTGVRHARSWEDTMLHMRLLENLPIGPSEALPELPEDDWAISFPATRLVLSQSAEDGRYTEWLDLTLGAD